MVPPIVPGLNASSTGNLSMSGLAHVGDLVSGQSWHGLKFLLPLETCSSALLLTLCIASLGTIFPIIVLFS